MVGSAPIAAVWTDTSPTVCQPSRSPCSKPLLMIGAAVAAKYANRSAVTDNAEVVFFIFIAAGLRTAVSRVQLSCLLQAIRVTTGRYRNWQNCLSSRVYRFSTANWCRHGERRAE